MRLINTPGNQTENYNNDAMENEDENLGKDNETINPNDIVLGFYRYPEVILLFLYILLKIRLKGCSKATALKMYWNLSRLAISSTPFLEAASYSVQIQDNPPDLDESKQE